MKEFQFRGMESPSTFGTNVTKKSKSPQKPPKKSKVASKKNFRKLKKDIDSLRQDFAQLNKIISESNLAKKVTASSKDKRPEDRIIHLVKRGDNG